MIKKSIFSILLVSFLSMYVAAQAKTIGTNTTSWFAYVGVHKISDNWSLLIEGQLRRSDFLANSMQVLFRPGLIYHINDNTTLGGGYLYAWTEPYGVQPSKAAFPENRSWQQLQFKSMHGNVELINRLRLEQRWVHSPVDKGNNAWEAGDAVYTNRVRNMLKASIPFKGKVIHDKTLYATVSNELMVNWGKNVKLNTFDQNRVFVGLGYKIPSIGRLEAGYLNQAIFKGTGTTIEQNHTISFWLFANFELRKKNKT
jgi:Protein of unknown function (DUF2490)